MSKNADRIQIGVPIPAFRLLVLCGLARSNSEAKRLIRQGAMRISYGKKDS